MSDASKPKHPSHHDVPDAPAPGAMPVEPDEGPVPGEGPDNTDDREDDRLIDPRT